MENLKPASSEEDIYKQTTEREQEMIVDTRNKFESGQLFQKLRYEPLPNGYEEAFEETVIREQASIDKARERISERSTIYG